MTIRQGLYKNISFTRPDTKIKAKTGQSEADYDIYNFKDSEIGESWLIGTDIYYGSNSSQWANAFKKGISACPEVLEIPGFLTDSSGMRRAVEIIGRGAFVACGCYDKCDSKGNTKRVKVPRQVKIVRSDGLAGMDDLLSFEIEEGSVLETIDMQGLSFIGYQTGQDPSKRTGTLILPSTLSLVGPNGIFCCNIFRTIIYCGSHFLFFSSDLEHPDSLETVIKVTSQYPSGEQIFGRNPDNSQQSIEEAEEVCRNFVSPFNFTDNGENVTITGWWRPESDLIIPSTINGLPVVAIEDEAFEGCMNVTGTVYVPPSVTSIGRRSFAGLRQAKKIIIEGSSKSKKGSVKEMEGEVKGGEVNIGEGAFAEFGADREGEEISVTLSGEIGSLGAGVFKSSKVTKVIIKS